MDPLKLIIASCTVIACQGINAGAADIRHSGAIGISAVDFDYRESENAARLNHEHGVLPALEIRWQTLGSQFLLEAVFSHMAGEVTYDGATQSGAPVRSDTEETIWQSAVTAGWRHTYGPSFEFQAIAALGYRHWERDIKPVANASGLLETYTFGYARVGLRTLYRASPKHSWIIEVAANRPLDPQVEVEFSNALDQVDLDLGESTALDINLSWRYELQPSLGLEAELFHHTWKMGRSADQQLSQNGMVVGTLFEPASKTTESGLTLRLVKRFQGQFEPGWYFFPETPENTARFDSGLTWRLP